MIRLRHIVAKLRGTCQDDWHRSVGAHSFLPCYGLRCQTNSRGDTIMNELIWKTANSIVKLLGTHLDHNRHGQSERALRLFCDYLIAVARGVESKLG
jgi:hypothetical protein